MKPAIPIPRVVNSARPHTAEGLARMLFWDEGSLQGARSRPSTVNPYAIDVVKGLGVDLGPRASKSVRIIDSKSTHTVIYPCSEEVCPASVGQARRLQWPVQAATTDDPRHRARAGAGPLSGDRRRRS